jgi:hypothetical protein
MPPAFCLAVLSAALAFAANSRADEPLRIIIFGAHPDDCEYDAGGTAARWAALLTSGLVMVLSVALVVRVAGSPSSTGIPLLGAWAGRFTTATSISTWDRTVSTRKIRASRPSFATS